MARAQKGDSEQAIGRSNGTDALGNPVRFLLLPARRVDAIGTRPLIDGLSFGALIADAAAMTAGLDDHGAKAVIVQHPRRSQKGRSTQKCMLAVT